MTFTRKYLSGRVEIISCKIHHSFDGEVEFGPLRKKIHDPPFPLTGKDTTSSSVWFFSLLSRLSLLSLSTSSSSENEKKNQILKFIAIIFLINKIIVQQTVLRSEDDYVNDESNELSKVATSKAIILILLLGKYHVIIYSR